MVTTGADIDTRHIKMALAFEKLLKGTDYEVCGVVGSPCIEKEVIDQTKNFGDSYVTYEREQFKAKFQGGLNQK